MLAPMRPSSVRRCDLRRFFIRTRLLRIAARNNRAPNPTTKPTVERFPPTNRSPPPPRYLVIDPLQSCPDQFAELADIFCPNLMRGASGQQGEPKRPARLYESARGSRGFQIADTSYERGSKAQQVSNLIGRQICKQGFLGEVMPVKGSFPHLCPRYDIVDGNPIDCLIAEKFQKGTRNSLRDFLPRLSVISGASWFIGRTMVGHLP